MTDLERLKAERDAAYDALDAALAAYAASHAAAHDAALTYFDADAAYNAAIAAQPKEPTDD